MICYRTVSKCKMYIIELIIKFLNKRKAVNKKISYYTASENKILEETEPCEHTFRPVDSTGMILACIKCGFVVNMNDNKNEDIL